jgi:preprotein translocase subunit SecA
MISKSIESAQKKVEGNNFDIRKHVLEYDDVMNKHREVIYKRRNNVLKAWDNEILLAQEKDKKFEVKTLKEMVYEMIEAEIEKIVSNHTASESKHDWNVEEIQESINAIMAPQENIGSDLRNITKEGDDNGKDPKIKTNLIKYIFDLAKKYYQLKEDEIQTSNMRQVERIVMLKSIDSLWMRHLDAMTHLRTSIGLRGYGQKDPLVEYKKESFYMFQGLLESIQKQVVYTIYKVALNQPEKTEIEKSREKMQTNVSGKSDSQQKVVANKINRNDPCPCGSGKKYKKCCGK